MKTLTNAHVRVIASAKSWIESEAVRQLYATARLDGMRQAVAFPDLHPGKCGPVGAVFITEGVLYPHLIGGDIGCGMTLFKTELLRRKARPDRWTELRFDLERPWEGDVCQHLAEADLCTTQFADSFGTLGSGNHFAELQAVEKVFDREVFDALALAKEELLLLVHSGSRQLGQSLLETYTEEHGARGVGADSDAATGYLLCHDHAVRWAAASRALIAKRFSDTLGTTARLVVNSCHNSISCRRHEGQTVWLHRKGATSAHEGAVVIAGSRGHMSYLVQPLNTAFQSGWSLAHGAGRKWSRSEARSRTRERFRIDALVQTPLGSRVICEERDLLYEESPLAYKNVERVIQDLREAGLVKVIATLRPLLTYKTRAAYR